MPIHHWENLNTFAFKDLDPQRTIAIMTMGSIEQHGPHLPVGVDATIVRGVLHGILKRVPDDMTAIALPVLPIGKAIEHENFDGTLSLSTETVMALWREIAASVFRTPVRKLLMLNSHGGQSDVARIVARDLRAHHKALVVPVNWWTYKAKTLYQDTEYTHGLHGGAEETALMLHLQPDLVNHSEIKNFVPVSLEQAQQYPMLYGDGAKHAWMAEDLHPQGATGDATIATQEDGQKICEEAVESMIALLQEMVAYQI